ncbi:MAG: septum formation protein Maf [Porticoccaceae bacterium]|jgi:septum formation protein|nr:septum formation protein Maf [Porticoccaceae bacterium]
MQPIILASSSPYKKMLLQRLGIEFTCAAPDIDESPLPGETAIAMAQRLAEEKAQRIAWDYPQAIVIGADQVEELDGAILGKPGNHQRAVAQLSAQSGRTVLFHCGISVAQINQGKLTQQSRVNSAEVCFRTLSAQQIEDYLIADQPYDCAGSFKAEALGISLFAAVNSNDPSSLVGLPLIDLCSILGEWDIKIP